MTIQQPWWPSGQSSDDAVHINKAQAGMLISLAMYLDKEQPPKSLHLQAGDTPITTRGGTVMAVLYVIGPGVKSDVYRKYCDQLWLRCSDQVKLLYMVAGLSPAINYALDIMKTVELLQHRSKEIRDDWSKCVVCLSTMVTNINSIRVKVARDSVLPAADPTSSRRQSFHMDTDAYKEARERIPENDLPRVTSAFVTGFRRVFDMPPADVASYCVEGSGLPDPTVVVDANGTVSDDAAVYLIGNPIYAGLSPYNGVLSDRMWVYLNVKLLDEIGPEQYLVNLLYMLRETYDYHFGFSPDDVEEYDDEEEDEGGGDGAGGTRSD